MKKIWIFFSLLLGCVFSAQAWDRWEEFKSTNVVNGRVIDYSDARHVTTSEGQSYALFFSLVAQDQKSFNSLLSWTEKNLSKGRLNQQLPAWLWGRQGKEWTVLDTNNAIDSDMWIAYSLLEAGRLWQREDYRQQGLKLLDLLKTQVREVGLLGKVLLPGRMGFEKDELVKLNCSYYPLFILKRFAQEDNFWNDVFDGSLRVLMASSPSGIAPDWSSFTKQGELIRLEDEDSTIGSYNAIRVYLWAGMMSKRDPAYRQLKDHFEPMIQLTETLNAAPEKVNIHTLKVNHGGSVGFAASMLPYLKDQTVYDRVRTDVSNYELDKESYYSNVLILYGEGFDQKFFAFDENGYLFFPRSAM